MVLIEQIIEWAKKRSAWERDLIKRVFENGDLKNNDKKELIDLIKKEHGLIDESEIIVKPIEEYLPSESVSVKKQVHIEKLHSIKNVNRLKEGEVLSFNKNGLTIVYGENASGKSGYSRVLKRACRARHSGRILPNVYEENNHTATAEAVFEIECDGTSMSAVWHDVDDPSATLTCISVFDKHCARIYVNEKNQIDYLPYGADILPKLIDAIEEFKEYFERNEKFTIPSLAEELLNALTEIGFENLEDLLREENYNKLQKLTNLTDDEKKKFNSLKETLLQRQANSPEKRAANMTRSKARLTNLKTSLEKLRLSLSDEKIEEITKIHQSYLGAKKAAEAASKTSFSSEPLEGIGSEAWRLMFEAAKKYSEGEAYKAVPFPVIDENSHCVLCQQELSEIAKARLKRFDDFVKDETSKKAKDAKTNIEEAYQDISKLNFDVLPSNSEIENDLTQNYPGFKEKIAEFVKSSKGREEALKRHFKEGSDLKLPEFVHQDVVETIVEEINEIENRLAIANLSEKVKKKQERRKPIRF
ncbi:hypothetical protein KJ780_05290 [Candidatus Micrarchaeota archaeon]|nr:hypothetical protein [Candidatus Micrarchaeota archaeon]